MATTTSSDDHGVHAPVSTVALSVTIKRVKLASLAVVVVGAVVVCMVLLQRGVTLQEHQELHGNAESQTNKLLSDYHWYTRIALWAATIPLWVFTTMVLQLTVIRFAATSMLVSQTARRIHKMTALVAFALVYLVLNGFIALSVELEPRSVKPVVSLSDLVLLDGTNSSEVTSTLVTMDTNATQIVPETTDGNLVTNTVLRTAVVPRVWQTPDTTCYYSEGAYQIQESCTETSVDFGFPSRPWISKMLPVAPATKTLTLSLLNGTSASASATPQAAQLPMNASMAATLVMHGIAQASIMANWFQFANIPETDSMNASVTKEKPLRSATARATGVLPPTDTRDEMKEREWLLKQVPRLLQNKFKEPKGTTFDQTPINDTESGVSLSFSHVDISEQITFDAVTIEAAVNTYKYTTAVDADKTTRYFTWLDAEESCGPKPWSICGVEKFSHAGDGSSAYYDLPSTIVAGRICLNGDGTETPMARYYRDSTGFLTSDPECNATSNSSMLVVSIAKRIVADSVMEEANARTKKLTGLMYPVLVNARKIYSITVGRLAWHTQDLAKVFGATCDVTTGAKCQGLQFPLRASASNESEVIVAGVDALPVKTLGKINGIKSFNKYTPLVRIREPLKFGDEQTTKTHVYDAVAGDLLLPHNLLVNRTRDVSTDNCQPRMEQRLHITLGNHLYMEHGLQPAYTAAMFYLFQNGVVKKSINMDTTDKSSTAVKTLSFDKNTQTSALVASIPLLNMYQSLVGCALLAIGVLATVFHSGSLLSSVGDSDDTNNTNTNANNSKNANNTNNANANNALVDSDKISDPRVIAQVMLDEGRFPPMFLERTLIDTSGHVSAAEMARFEISSMTLSTEGDDCKRIVLDKPTGPSTSVV